MVTFEEVLEKIFSESNNKKEQGDAFERATVYYLQNDPLYSERFSDVWLWRDSPTCTGQDIGVDVVARDKDDGTYWAIQCKCFKEDSSLTYKQISTFFSTAKSDDAYGHYMIVDTANTWSPNLKKIAEKYDAVRISADNLREADLDWEPFLKGKSKAERITHDPRPHQQDAIEAVVKGFEDADRGKLIMACGTGKTLTALRLAEEMCPKGTVLFLAPSISLVSQTLRAWANEARVPLRPFVVCSDTKASKLEDIWETSVADIPFPATTDSSELAKQIKKTSKSNEMTVVFSTYQSIQVVIDAQKKGAPTFDLCISDEAHRTTGVDDAALSKEEKSAFTKVHDAKMLKAKKRLYMTATPRIYSTNAQKKAHEESYEVSSMDDPTKYGEEFYRLSFGRAVEQDLLSDYRVIVLTVSEEMASQVYQQTMEEETDEGFDVPEVAKILGCWKGLATRGEQTYKKRLVEEDLKSKSRIEEYEAVFPMQRAVAFSSTIKDSQRFADIFQNVVDSYIDLAGLRDDALKVETQHVDGSMDSTTRKSKLRWLEENPGDDICRVLTNAKCLSEGIDVPSLDAVLFMRPRRSQVDIIQAVGRVMRKAENKRYGYIILPVVVPAGMTPEEALDDDKAFAVVWQILQALRSHDERLDARINALKFEKSENEVIKLDHLGGGDDDDKEVVQEKLALQWSVQEWQDAMEATLVKKCGTRVYWEDWADDVAGIAKRHIARITDIVDTDKTAAAEFEKFLTGLRDSLNPGITKEQAIEMLAQHLITLPVFETLFGDASFVQSNPVSIAMENMMDVLRKHAIEDREDDKILDSLYASVRSRVSIVHSAAGRQAIIKELYEGFFSKAFKSDVEKMGIVYTPNEIVNYILHATDRMLKSEFGEGLGSKGVHILDPFAGTGTFIADLIESDIISDKELPYKYAHELHSNEIMLLAYYIMVINIESAYHTRMEGDYKPFDGAVLTDTFQMTEETNTLDDMVFTDNTDRLIAQNKLDIRVIVGNPPYSAGQRSANDNNQNESYATLDHRIAETYAAKTTATNKNALYDSYIRAFRWASDRIGDAGIVCFVSNAGWVDGQATNGMRQCLADEFSSIYVFHLRGNQRTQGEESRREGGKVFGSGSRAPIAITMLVKNPASTEHGKIYFHDVGDYLTREEKLTIVNLAAKDGLSDWTEIHPDKHGDWLDQRDDSFEQFAPMGLEKYKLPQGMFVTWSNGLQTNRDAWIYNFSKEKVAVNMYQMIKTYNKQVKLLADSTGDFDSVVTFDPHLIKWSSSLQQACIKGITCKYTENKLVLSSYRPFCREWTYFDSLMNHRPYQLPKVFPLGLKNIAIMTAEGSVFITNILPDLELVHHGQCFPLYWYEEVKSSAYKNDDQLALFDAGKRGTSYVRHDAITDEALEVFRSVYPKAFLRRQKKNGGSEITKEDIFYYVYGILHSEDYRKRFDANLKKELPRIPLAQDFVAFSKAGRELAHWHIDYETIKPYPLKEVGDSKNPGRTEKITFGKCKKDEAHPKGEDHSILHVAENLTLEDIPENAYDYVVNGKSAIGWLMDRYRVTTDKASGIVNDPNEYSDDPRYIVDLVKRVVRVSLETLEIIGNMPKQLNELPQPTDWPAAWKLSEEA